MPYKKKNIRRKTKVRRKKGSRKNGTTNVPYTKNASPIAERAFMKLRYVDVTNITIAGSLLTTAIGFQSSLAAPRYVGTGHQPLYFDQWCTMYSRYRVYGVKYHFTIINRSTNECFWAGVRHQDTNVSETSLQTLLERGDAHMKIGTSVNSAGNVVVIKGYLSVAKTLGIALTAIKNDNEFGASVVANPSRMAYLPLYILSNLTSGNVVFEVTCRLTYYCEMSDQVAVGAS